MESCWRFSSHRGRTGTELGSPWWCGKELMGSKSGNRRTLQKWWPRVWEWGRWMLVDADGMGQDDGRTERGKHVRATGWRHRYRRMTWVLAKSHMLCCYWRKHNLPGRTNPTPLEHWGKSKTSVEPQEETRQFQSYLDTQTLQKEDIDWLEGEIFTTFPSLSLDISLKFVAYLKEHERSIFKKSKWHLDALSRR